MSKKYKIAVGGMNHESNTFNPIITGENEFVVLRGEEFESKVGDTYNSAKGLYEKLKSYGYDVVPEPYMHYSRLGQKVRNMLADLLFLKGRGGDGYHLPEQADGVVQKGTDIFFHRLRAGFWCLCRSAGCGHG